MNPPDQQSAFEAFCSVDFNWAIRLEDIWRAPTADVPALHHNARKMLFEELDRLERIADNASPLGRFIVGEGGSGKTHLLSAIRQEVAGKGFGFILVDMTDVRDFWETVAQGYLNSLQATYLDDKPQHAFVLKTLLGRIPLKHPIDKSLEILASRKPEALKNDVNSALRILQKAYPGKAHNFQDTIRAVFCLNSTNFGIADAGFGWLQGLEMDDVVRLPLGFHKPREQPREIVRGLSWLLSLAGPSVLAFDQLDPIVHQVARQNITANAEEQNTARRIIDQIGNGFAALRETTTKTLVLVSCLEPSYRLLADEVLASNLDRFHPPTRLRNPGEGEYRALIEKRLSEQYQRMSVRPPYPAWPFAAEAVKGLDGQSPRRVFQLCEGHRRRSVESGQVEELKSFAAAPFAVRLPVGNQGQHLDHEFLRYQKEADPTSLRDEKNEDDELAVLYRTALQCLIHEHDQILPPGVEVCLETEFCGSAKTVPLHARLRLQFQNEGDREEHYCIRVLLKKHFASFQSRLKSAITQSGIDKKLGFRHLTIVRFDAAPCGEVTQQLTEQYASLGGRWHRPSESELRSLFALAKLAESKNPAFLAWLAERKPVSRLALGHFLAPGSLFDSRHTRDIADSLKQRGGQPSATQ